MKRTIGLCGGIMVLTLTACGGAPPHALSYATKATVKKTLSDVTEVELAADKWRVSSRHNTTFGTEYGSDARDSYQVTLSPVFFQDVSVKGVAHTAAFGLAVPGTLDEATRALEGVGPTMWRKILVVQEGGEDKVSWAVGSVVPAEDGVTIERIRYTGDAAYPWEWQGSLKADASGAGGTFKIAMACGDLGCNATWHESFDAGWTQEEIDKKAGDCPTEIRELFWKAGPAAKTDTSLSWGGAEKMSCLTTKAGGFICGATKENVQADGCTWTVDALSKSNDMKVRARADESCTRAAGRYCGAGG